MTVADLVRKLQAMPQNIPVVIQMCSTIYELEDDQPQVENLIKRGDYYVGFNEYMWDRAKDGEPVFIPVCSFPGN